MQEDEKKDGELPSDSLVLRTALWDFDELHKFPGLPFFFGIHDVRFYAGQGLVNNKVDFAIWPEEAGVGQCISPICHGAIAVTQIEFRLWHQFVSIENDDVVIFTSFLIQKRLWLHCRDHFQPEWHLNESEKRYGFAVCEVKLMRKQGITFCWGLQHPRTLHCLRQQIAGAS